jgi:hypothetical protein
VILADERGAAIAREVQGMLPRRPGRTLQKGSLSTTYRTPLDQLIKDSVTET